MNNKKAVVLLSGGMDSCVTAGVASRDYEPCFLHINYGQRTEKKELKAFQQIADHYQVKERLIIDLNHFKQIGGSALTDKKIDVPQGLSVYGIPTTYVPFRNANLLSAAVSWAETIKAEKIFIGATEEDSAGYPDCRVEFYQVFNHLIKVGTKIKNIEIMTPIIQMKKADIVKLGRDLNVPFELTWSCYELSDKACGECDSCLRRKNAFMEAGIDDPIIYLKK